MARLDTGWHANPKVLRLSAAGMALHAWSISYCDAAQTDGFIPHGAWPSKLQRGVRELEQAAIYAATEGGYRLHDYLDYNRSRAQIAALAAAMRANGQAGGQAKALAKAKQIASQNAKQTVEQNGSKLSSKNLPPVPVPVPVNSLLPGGRLVSPGVPHAREALPDEVLARLTQPPIANRPADQPA